jgi:hypothetical protein
MSKLCFWADLREVVILGGVPDRVPTVGEGFTVTRTSSSAAGQVIELSGHCDIDDVGQFGPSRVGEARTSPSSADETTGGL